MPGVAVRHDERLVIAEVQILQQPVGYLHHLCPANGVVRIERERDVVDGPLDPVRSRGRCPHEKTGCFWIAGRQVPPFDPLDAIGVVRLLPGL